MQDYYEVLGVLPSAELAVIKGAYKAMMSIYHPDKYQGDRDFAHIKTLQIQEAYKVLKDPVSRAAYDETLGTKHDYTEEEQEAKATSDEERKLNTEDWQYALKYHPELVVYEQELALYSPTLAMQFRLALIETKEFNRAADLSRKLQREYFERYFGKNLMVHEFARNLLKLGRRDAAKELNKAINFLGANADSDKLIAAIKQEFGLVAGESHKTTGQPWTKDSGSQRSTAVDSDKRINSFEIALFFTLLVAILSSIPHTLGGFVDFILFLLFIYGCMATYRSYPKQ